MDDDGLVKQLVRKDDPETSLEAARRAVHASGKAIDAVQRVMGDGVDRIDEEIWHACRQTGFLRSLDTVRHARLALVRDGRLCKTGGTRRTTLRRPSRVWSLGREP